MEIILIIVAVSALMATAVGAFISRNAREYRRLQATIIASVMVIVLGLAILVG